jgi:formamidopyrimidine-DNA glycosylase
MPELPDVEIFRQVVDRQCLGRRIERAVVADPGILDNISANALADRLAGAVVRSAHRHGKHLLIAAPPAGVLAMHFGMNGALRFLADKQEEPPYLRLFVDFAGGGRLLYINPRRLGRVALADSAEAFVAAAGLGPDALDPGFDLPAFAGVLAGRKRDIKSVLMEQSLLAGIGNIYSDEILFQAGIHPATPAMRLDRGRAEHLFRTMKRVLQTAIDHAAGAESGGERLPPGFLLPERRRGGHCPHCNRPLATLKRGARTGYFCPHCQPA